MDSFLSTTHSWTKDEETPVPRGKTVDPVVRSHPDDDDPAAAKLWAVYISEAEKYDKALVDGWRRDMDGLLIFAGLFSASLTAFLIESYKTLMPDQGEITITILTQISRQLAVPGNGSSMEPPTPSVFAPSAAALTCNTLWFLSLGLSLSCALLATLIEQWARDFIQKTDMRPSPIIRARIFSYLYYGLRRFKMHAVVELIPMLLHMSLILFFAGLVAFLYPVNIAITAVAAVILLVICSVYSYLTVLPILHSDCPYRTPLSAFRRQLCLQIASLRRSPRQSQAADEEAAHITPYFTPREIPTLVEDMIHDARYAPNRAARDCGALIWTMQSLTDDDELEPFVEALPHVLWGTTGRRRAYDTQIGALLVHPEARLVPRIEGLLRSCESGLLPPEPRHRRQVSCFKAIWAIAHLDVESAEPFHGFDFQAFQSTPWDMLAPSVRPYLLSAQALARSNVARWSGAAYLKIWDQLYSRPADILPHAAAHEPLGWTHTLLGLDRPRVSVNAIMIKYLVGAADLELPPYELQATCDAIMHQNSTLSDSDMLRMHWALEKIIGAHAERLKSHPAPHHIDMIVQIVISLSQGPHLPYDADTTQFIAVLLRYISVRDADEALVLGLGSFDPMLLFSRISSYLKTAALKGHEEFKSIQRLCAFYVSRGGDSALWAQMGGSGFDGWTLIAVKDMAPSDISPSIVALMEILMLLSLPVEELPSLPVSAFTCLAAQLPWHDALSETHWFILIEFMESCSGRELPYKAAETLGYILSVGAQWMTHKDGHLQRRFASALVAFIRIGSARLDERTQAITELLTSFVFMAYAGPESAMRDHPIVYDDPGAAEMIVEALGYVDELESQDMAPLARLISHNLRSKHLSIGIPTPDEVNL
ncbi:hypothetical protein DFH09DRAFT_984122 [Mycena vulgaris]|nr:hypothetical protein DFH09DRAFT_984122 [Mycena vulgaris]